MRVKLLQTRLLHHSRFCLETYGGVEHGERGKRYFLVRDADKSNGEPGSSPILYITEWHHDALGWMQKEVER